MDKPSPNRTQPSPRKPKYHQPIKGSKDIYENFQFVKVSAQMVRLCLKKKWNETFSPTQFMNENKLLIDKWLREQGCDGYVSSYWRMRDVVVIQNA